MMKQVALDGEEIRGDYIDVRALRERRIGGVAHTTSQSNLRHAHALLRLARAVFEFGEGTACRDEICLTAAPALIGRFGRVARQACLADLYGNQSRRGLGIVTREPSARGLAFELNHGRVADDGRA